MVEINVSNHQMIMDIFDNDIATIKVEKNPSFIKYINPHFDVVIKNNSSIIVIDKRKINIDGIPIIYKDLKTAHTHIVGIS